MSMSALTWPFNKLLNPTVPKIPPPAPPTPPPQNTPMEAQMAQAGRQQGLLSALFGYRNPSGTSTTSHTLTGQ
jgi:hypothetical protein